MSVIFNPNFSTDLAYTASPTQGTITSDTGTDATIPAADGTNAGLFLPAEKTKLAGIAAGAEVNVNADWNASSGDAQILNKPTLGTAAATNSTDYATAAQGTKADTAVQPAALASYQPLATALTNTTAAFTTAQETKLAGIAAGAEVNVNADWNASSGDAQILNKPTLGTAAATNSTDYATAAQGTKADTAVQPAALASYQPLATVLTNTTAAFTTAQETKLAGIAAGAEVNVNADWNAVSGDAQILNKPTLGTAAATNSTDYATSAQGAKADTAVQPAAIGSTILAYDANLQTFVNTFTLPTTDGTSGQSLVTNGAGALSFATVSGGDPAYIAGVAYFNRSTKPTERSAGVPLVVGDHWYNTSDGTEGFWNGTYWLSLTEFLLSIPEIVGQTANQVIPGSSAATTGSIFVDKLVHQTAVLNSTNTATNYWTLAVQVSGVSATTISTQNATNYPHQQVSLGLVIPARSAIPTGGSVVFTGLGQTSSNWYGMTTLGTDVYACVYGGDIYKQTNGTGNFLPLGQTSRQWVGMTTLGTDVYACVYNGDIYKQTNGTGNFLPLGQTSRQWLGMTTLGTDVYASVNGGDIYKQTNGTGNFLPLGQTSRSWFGMTTLGTDVYACVYGGDIYKQTNGTGNFLPLGQTSRQWYGMTTLGTDVYACVYGGDIYKTSWFIDTVGHSARVTTTRVGTQTTSLYSAMSLTYRKVL